MELITPANTSLQPMDVLIQKQVPLDDKNWFKTGGKAEFFAAPQTETDFVQALQFAHDHKLDINVLGSGANILIADQGVKGLVIQPHIKDVHIVQDLESEVIIKAGAGILFHDLIDHCLNHNLLGLEEFSGIPGTVGGAAYINIHYYEFLLEQFITGAHIINKQTGQIFYVPTSWFEYGYDDSKLIQKEFFVSYVYFKLKKATPEEVIFARGRRKEIIRHRERRYPTARTCGSFFRNFFPEEVQHTASKLIFVAYYLDKLGIKGELQIGKAKVSHQHANMLISQPGATSQDIIDLAIQMQTKVYSAFGILPQAECQMLGFDKYPLLQLNNLD